MGRLAQHVTAEQLRLGRVVIREHREELPLRGCGVLRSRRWLVPRKRAYNRPNRIEGRPSQRRPHVVKEKVLVATGTAVTAVEVVAMVVSGLWLFVKAHGLGIGAR